MSAIDDLAPLLRPNGTPDVGFRQGTVEAWDEATGSNSVNVAGVSISDVPVLNLGEFTLLQPGDVVGLLRFKSTYFILGRIILPRAPDANRATLSFGSDTGRESGFSVTTLPAEGRGLVTIPAPSWADEALVLVTATGQAVNSRTEVDYLGIKVQVNGVDAMPGAFFGPAGQNEFASGSVVGSALVTDVGSTVNGRAIMWANGDTWAANASNGVNTTVTAFFRRVS